ncbi:wax ester/triacylglycerol synthase family O-acyltransferase [Rhodococcus olei]|uniref:diacylglycerol O-acyltransferase n=2 Tax=Rhodococcus olei TaxID=2161675 RepID=A0ABP8PLT4_9NOCA
MRSPRRYLTQTDLMSWRMEADPVLRSTIVAVALLDRRPDWDRFVSMMERGTRRVPLFRCKVVTPRFGMSPPYWVDDPDFDLSWHLRSFTLSDREGWGGVLDFARTAAMSAFDKDRPLWEFTVLGGLAGGRAALVTKVHHSLTDGVGGMQIVREIVDLTRDGDERPHEPSEDVPSATGAAPRLGYWPDRLATGGRSALRASTAAIRNPAGVVRGTSAALASTMRLTRPVFSTLSPVMTERSTLRRLATLDVAVRALDGAAEASGGSINDAFLAAVLLGAARYHRHHGAAVDRLRVTLPISLRTERDAMGGNRITLARFPLPTDVADPVELIGRVHTLVDTWRHEPAVRWSPAIAGTLNLLPAAVLVGMLEHVDLVASNVTGSPVPLFTAGAQILGHYAFSPTLGSAFNVTLMSYRSRCCIGVNADAAAVPDVDVLAGALADGFREVVALCPDAAETAVMLRT